MLRTQLQLSSTLFLCLLPSLALAQFEQYAGPAQEGSVSGMGTVKLDRTPSILRMSIQLSEKAESLEDALAKMKDRREAVTMQLEELGAVKDSIQVQPPQLASADSVQQRQMAQIMQMRRMQGRRVPDEAKAPTVSNITALVTAEWTLEQQDHDAMLMFVKQLKDEITKADLAGLKEPEKLSPEAAEVAEEMEAMMAEMSYGEESVKPGEPTFFFVAQLLEADHEEALATAFERAKKQAGQLAKAAGTELGPLASLSGMIGQSDETMSGYYDGPSYQMRRMMARLMNESGDTADQMEAVSPDPSKCSFQATVQSSSN